MFVLKILNFDDGKGQLLYGYPKSIFILIIEHICSITPLFFFISTTLLYIMHKKYIKKCLNKLF